MNLKEISYKEFFKKYQVAINTMNFDKLEEMFAPVVKTQMLIISEYTPETEIDSADIINSWKNWVPKLTSFQHIYSNPKAIKSTDNELIISADSSVTHEYKDDKWETWGKMVFQLNSECKIVSMLNVIERQSGDYTLIEKVLTGE